MKKIKKPSLIYLQTDPESDKPSGDYYEDTEVTWCEDKINQSDTPYFRLEQRDLIWMITRHPIDYFNTTHKLFEDCGEWIKEEGAGDHVWTRWHWNYTHLRSLSVEALWNIYSLQRRRYGMITSGHPDNELPYEPPTKEWLDKFAEDMKESGPEPTKVDDKSETVYGGKKVIKPKKKLSDEMCIDLGWRAIKGLTVDPCNDDGLDLVTLKKFLMDIFSKSPPKTLLANREAAEVYAKMLGYNFLDDYIHEQFAAGKMTIELPAINQGLGVEHIVDLGPSDFYKVEVEFIRRAGHIIFNNKQSKKIRRGSSGAVNYFRTIKEVNQFISGFEPTQVSKIEIKVSKSLINE